MADPILRKHAGIYFAKAKAVSASTKLCKFCSLLRPTQGHELWPDGSDEYLSLPVGHLDWRRSEPALL